MTSFSGFTRKSKRLLLLPIFISLFLVCCSSANDAVVFPASEWLISSPEDQGVDSDRMNQALDYLESRSLHNGNKEMVIVRNGFVIFRGENADSTHNIWSCTKTFTSTVLGLLIDEGKVTMHDKAARFEPLLQEAYPEVTFRHFTTMTSGYSAKGNSRWCGDCSEDWSKTVYVPDAPMFAPGEAFAYWDEAQMMLGRTLTQVLGTSMEVYLRRKLTDRIGMGDWHWDTEKSIQNIPINNGCTGVHVNALQLARWGWLFLNKGRWNGEQLVSPDWIAEATSVQVTASLPVADTDRKITVGPGCYGYNWWVNGKMANGELKLPGAPEGCYFASGHNNNKCIVIPQWNMVVVRMGEDGHPENKDVVYGKFIEMLGNAII